MTSVEPESRVPSERTLRVLIIEDNPPDAELTVATLKRGGSRFTYRVVDSPQTFQQELEQAECDMIIADYNLRTWNALDALEVVRRLGKDIPFILVTGTLGEEAAVECIKQGATDYILKDRMGRLPSAVTRALADKAQRDERRRAEEAVRASEIGYRRLFEAARDGILILDALTGAITDANPFIAGLLGYSRDSLLGMKLWEIDACKNIEASEIALRKLQNEEYIRYDDLPLETNDGKRIEVEFVSNAYMVDEKKVIQCNIRDITERKRTEWLLVNLRKAVDNSGEVIFMTNPAGIFTFINPEFTRLYGHTAEEILGKATPRILKSGKRPTEDFASYWQTLLSGRVVKGTHENRAKDGRLIEVDASASSILDEAGAITGFIAIQRDVTEHRKLEEQFRQSQKMEAVGQLAGGIAHDFNNLLTVITGFSDLLLEKPDNDASTREYTEEIRKAGARAALLTRQLLAFSRRQVFLAEVMDLNTVVAEVDSMLRRLIGEDIELKTILSPNLGRVRVDPGQIHQILMNLAVNSRDAMPRGGKLTIETTDIELDSTYARGHGEVKTGPYVMLAVSDTGTGMDAETQSHIFEPFFTTKEKGKGTGLGLATVYGIVKQSGGNIWVYSEPGRGTTFKIYLPRVDEAQRVAKQPPPSQIAHTASETILLVEDEAGVRALARKVLESHGYTVLEASRGEEALSISVTHQGPVHLLLTDVVMPGMSGRVLADRLASRHPGMKVLFMSGYTDEAIVHHGVLDGAFSFLQKPFTPEALARKVREKIG